jgi:Glycosyltransferase family 87
MEAPGYGTTLWLYVLSSCFALATLGDRIPLQRRWAGQALPIYVVAAVLTLCLWACWSRTSERTRTALMFSVAGLVLVGATVLPLAGFVITRSHTEPGSDIQSEALMVEEGAIALAHGWDPYAVSFERTPLGQWPSGTELHYPYPPGSLLFGLPRAALGSSPLTDARVPMALFTVAIVVAAFAILRPSPHAVIVVGLALFALPTGARYIVGGGTDLPSLGLMLFSLALFASDRPVGAGVAAGLAVCMKHLALPLVLCLPIAVFLRHGSRATGRMLLASLLPISIAIVPFFAWSPSTFVDDVVRFPLGLSREPTIAQSPTLGRSLAAVAPVPRPMLAAALLLAVVVTTIVASLRRQGTKPTGPAVVSNTAALLTGLLIVTATAGRWGYLIYPINLFIWARVAFESSSRRPHFRGHLIGR